MERLTAGSRRPQGSASLLRKIIIPPPDSRDPPDGPPYFAKKCSPLTAGTHWTGHRISRKKRSPRCQIGPIGSILYVESLSWVHVRSKCLLITRKIIIPPPDSRDRTGHQYFAKKTFPPDCWDPPDRPAYFAKKRSPRCQLGPPEVPPYYAQKMNTPPASWDPPWWEADLWAY